MEASIQSIEHQNTYPNEKLLLTINDIENVPDTKQNIQNEMISNNNRDKYTIPEHSIQCIKTIEKELDTIKNNQVEHNKKNITGTHNNKIIINNRHIRNNKNNNKCFSILIYTVPRENITKKTQRETLSSSVLG